MQAQIRLTVALLIAVSAVVAFAKADAIGGKWESATSDKVLMDLKVEGKTLTGTVTVGEKPFPIEDGKVIDSKTVSFAWTTAFPPEGRQVRRTAVGKLSGDELKLTIKVTIEDTGQESDESMTLKRSK